MILTVIRLKPVRRIIIRSNESDELERFCHSLQIVTRRDLEGTVTEIIRAILEEPAGELIGSSELANRTQIKRVTIIHHLQRLERVGIVIKERHKYKLSPDGFSDIVKKMREETEQVFNEAQMLALRLDKEYCIGQKNQKQKRRIKIFDE